MTPKKTRLTKVSRDRHTLYWNKAMEFFEAMVDASQKKTGTPQAWPVFIVAYQLQTLYW